MFFKLTKLMVCQMLQRLSKRQLANQQFDIMTTVIIIIFIYLMFLSGISHFLGFDRQP